MDCFDSYMECVYYAYSKDGDECEYYEDFEQYCFFSVENIAWWWWLILAVGIVMLISFIACCVCCCCKKKVKYQKIVEVQVPKPVEQQIPVQYQQNVQPVMPQMYIPQPVYQPMPMVPQYNGQYQPAPFGQAPTMPLIK
ncbi:Hypothetical_protein [Hexamita inflata]|uniref:Hypothetical_protein n=1 Tax=Hexamita inflata TaxID=28002 RepID=A0AA86U2N0_9EUKA|nr:Hypothetical protein HINF_LOCUS25201 [Hexamita inflata]